MRVRAARVGIVVGTYAFAHDEPLATGSTVVVAASWEEYLLVGHEDRCKARHGGDGRRKAKTGTLLNSEPFDLRMCEIFFKFQRASEFELKSYHYWAQK